MEPELVQPIIKVRELKKTYHLKNRHIQAVKGVSFEVNQGEVFGLLGPNGAGKTTTIGMLTTRVTPGSGKITIGDTDIAHKNQIKREIAVVPQMLTLDRSLTARENLIFHAKYYGIPKTEREAKADELLDWLALTGRQNDFILNFSGGMAQRLMIARALMHKPKVVFLDEATTGLDPQSRRLLWDKIKELNKEGQTILLTTHYMEEADSLCDRVAIMDKGEILAIGKPSELKKMIPSSHVIEAEISHMEPAFFQAVEEMRLGTLRQEGTRFFLYSESGSSLIHKLVNKASDFNVEMLAIQLHTPTLEDVFIHLTGRGLRD